MNTVLSHKKMTVPWLYVYVAHLMSSYLDRGEEMKNMVFHIAQMV